MRREQVGTPRISSRAGAEGVCRTLVVGSGDPPAAFEVVGVQLFVKCGQLHSIALAMTRILDGCLRRVKSLKVIAV
jgi:hypothetical protein